jgi:hypothetical protein
MDEVITSAHVDTFERLARHPLHDMSTVDQAKWNALPYLLRAMCPRSPRSENRDHEWEADAMAEDVGEVVAGLRSVLADAAQTAQGERAADREVERLTALVDSLKSTIAEHVTLRDELHERVIAADQRAHRAEVNLQKAETTIADRDCALRAVHFDRTALATIVNKVRALTGATADGDVVALVERLRARAEGRADVRVVESEVERLAREFAVHGRREEFCDVRDPTTGVHQYYRRDLVPLTDDEARTRAEQHLADRDARRKAGGAA